MWCASFYRRLQCNIIVTHSYHLNVFAWAMQVFLVSAERAQCWNSRHADIDFLCFQPIARYSFLSDETEEQSDTHWLSEDAREGAYVLRFLALTMLVEGDLMCFPACLTCMFFRCSAPKTVTFLNLTATVRELWLCGYVEEEGALLERVSTEKSDRFILILINQWKEEQKVKFVHWWKHRCYSICAW